MSCYGGHVTPEPPLHVRCRASPQTTNLCAPPSTRPRRRKAAAAAGRKDAKLQYVVISEKWDKCVPPGCTAVPLYCCTACRVAGPRTAHLHHLYSLPHCTSWFVGSPCAWLCGTSSCLISSCQRSPAPPAPALSARRKSSKYKTPPVPVAFNSKDTYEQSMRQPLGREYNTGGWRYNVWVAPRRAGGWRYRQCRQREEWA